MATVVEKDYDWRASWQRQKQALKRKGWVVTACEGGYCLSPIDQEDNTKTHCALVASDEARAYDEAMFVLHYFAEPK